VVSNLHLGLDQVLCLRERPNKLVSFFSLERTDLVLVHHIGNLELLLLCLQLSLLVYELLPQDAFLVVEIEEDGEVLG